MIYKPGGQKKPELTPVELRHQEISFFLNTKTIAVKLQAWKGWQQPDIKVKSDTFS